MTRWSTFAFALALAVSACAPEAVQTLAPLAEAQPRPEMQEAFGSCAWEQVTGVGLSVYSYACGPEHGDARLIADEDMQGFSIETAVASGHTIRTPVIRVFSKAANAPIDSIVPEIGAVSPPLDGGSCALARVDAANDPRPGDGRVRYVWAPVGRLKTNWDAANNGGVLMPSPCGNLGVKYKGAVTFEALADDPTKVVAVTWGETVQIFDPSTISSTEGAAFSGIKRHVDQSG
jgi:hypothetical protein